MSAPVYGYDKEAVWPVGRYQGSNRNPFNSTLQQSRPLCISWRHDGGGEVFSVYRVPLLFENGDVVVGFDSGYVIRFSRSGTVMWNTSGILDLGVPITTVLHNSSILITTSTGFLYFLKATTGELETEFTKSLASSALRYSPLVSADGLIVLTNESSFHYFYKTQKHTTNCSHSSLQTDVHSRLQSPFISADGTVYANGITSSGGGGVSNFELYN